MRNFGSKEKLFEAVVEQMCADVTIQIDTSPEGTIDEQLARIAHSFLGESAVAADPAFSPADDVDWPHVPGRRPAVL